MTQELIINFLKNASTRCGAAFEVTSLQKDINGNVNMLKGTVTPPNAKDSIPMYWNINGYSLNSPVPVEYDLIIEEPITY